MRNLLPQVQRPVCFVERSFRMAFVLALAAGIFTIVNVEAQATTRRVPLDYPTVQAGINASGNGDIVLVAPGTYIENINFLGKALTVTSEGGPQVTTIDASGADSVVAFASEEGPNSILNGFTLQNGRSGFDTPGFGDGGGIRIRGASPTITRNIIKNNLACNGCGISIFGGSPLIQLNTITHNTRDGCSGGFGGAGIMIFGSSS